MKLNKIKHLFALLLPLFLSSCLLTDGYCVTGNKLFEKNTSSFSGTYDNHKTVNVAATQSTWINSEVSVITGQKIQIIAKGVIILAPGWGTRTDIGDISSIIEMQEEMSDSGSTDGSTPTGETLVQDPSDVQNNQQQLQDNQVIILSPDGIYKNDGKGERYCISVQDNKSQIVGPTPCPSQYNSSGFLILTDSNCKPFKPIQTQSLVFTVGDCSDNFGVQSSDYYGYPNDVSGVTCNDNKWTWTNNWEYKNRDGYNWRKARWNWYYQLNGPYSFSSNSPDSNQAFCDKPGGSDYPWWHYKDGTEDHTQEYRVGGTDQSCWNRNGYGLYYSIYTSDSTANNDPSNNDIGITELYNINNDPTTTSPLRYNYDGVGLKISNRSDKNTVDDANKLLNQIASKNNDLNQYTKLDQDANIDRNNQLALQEQLEAMHANDATWIKENDPNWSKAQTSITADNTEITKLEGTNPNNDGEINEATNDLYSLNDQLSTLGLVSPTVPKAGGYTVYVKAKPFFGKNGERLDVVISNGPITENSTTYSVPYNADDFVAPGNGTIWFKIDDNDYDDNSGSYSVAINTEGTNASGAFSKIIEGIFYFIQNKLLGMLSKTYANITCTGGDISSCQKLNDQINSMSLDTTGATETAQAIGSQNIDCSQGLVNKNCTSFTKIIRISLILYISFFGISFALGITQINQYDFIGRMLKIAFIIFLTKDSSWEFFSFTLFPAIMDASMFLISAAVGTTDSIHPFSFMDPIMNVFLDPATWIKMLALIFASILGVLYFALILFGTVKMLYNLIEVIARYALAFMALGLILSMAPIFISFMLFKQTKNLFDIWIKAIFRYILEPVLLIVVTALLCSIIQTFMVQIFSFAACSKCAFPIKIGFPFLPIPSITLFCLPFLLPWGIDNSSDTAFAFLMSLIPFSSIIGFIILVKILEHSKELVEKIGSSILGVSNASITAGPSGRAEAQDYKGAKDLFKKVTGTDDASKARRGAELGAKRELVGEHDAKMKKEAEEKAGNAKGIKKLLDLLPSGLMDEASNIKKNNLMKDLTDGDKSVEKDLFGNNGRKAPKAKPASLKAGNKNDLFGDGFNSKLTGDKKDLFADDGKKDAMVDRLGVGNKGSIEAGKDLFGDNDSKESTKAKEVIVKEGDKKDLFKNGDKEFKSNLSDNEKDLFNDDLRSSLSKDKKDLFGDDFKESSKKPRNNKNLFGDDD